MSSADLKLWLGSRDERLLIAVVRRRRPRLDRFFRAVTHLADPGVAIPMTLALWLGAVPALAPAGERAAATLALTHFLVELLKRSVVRARPSLPVGLGSLVQAPDRFSFPSGHAAAALAMAIPVAVALGSAVGAGVLGVALLVGVSRCYLGVHYPGDVMAGWLIALGSGMAVSLA